MDGGGDDLAGIQSELQAVKKALRDGAVHLGMKGENLQRYLLQLNEKENLLLSRQLRHMAVSDANEVGRSSPLGLAANGYGNAFGGAGQQPARPPPAGPVKALNRDSLPAVFNHMVEYEAVPLECSRSLRALSSLAYANAASVGGDERILVQLLRMMALHPDEGTVHLSGMRALCNMAFDQTVAVKSLVDPKVMAALLSAVARAPNASAAGDDAAAKTRQEAAAKAGEAVARIVAAEVMPEEGKPRPVVSGLGALGGLFLAAASGEAPWQAVVPQLMSQLVANEVIVPRTIAEHFVRDASQCTGQVAVGWLTLAKHLAASDCPDLPVALIETGAIKAATELMERRVEQSAVQLAGVEAMSALVGNRWAGLQSFAEGGGIQRIEVAMRRHLLETVLQTKSIRALASGVLWPPEVQEKAAYSASNAVELTKTAMSKHEDCAELQAAALEALSKYLDKPRCIAEVSSNGGEGLVKVCMVRHVEDKKVQEWGRLVLDRLGVDPKWAPRGATAASS